MSIEITASDITPIWAGNVRRRVDELAMRPEGWDSYGACKLQRQVITEFYEVLGSLAHAVQSEPLISLTTEGGLIASWGNAQGSLEITVEPGQTPLIAYEGYTPEGVACVHCGSLKEDRCEGNPVRVPDGEPRVPPDPDGHWCDEAEQGELRCQEAEDLAEKLQEELDRVRRSNLSYLAEQHNIERVLAEVLGYQRDAVGDPDSPCPGEYVTGDHTALTLAMEAAWRIKELQTDLVATGRDTGGKP